MLFAGEEWAASSPFQYFSDHQDPDLARAVSEGRRREFASFGWAPDDVPDPQAPATFRSEEHTSELQSLMRSSYAVFRSKKKTQRQQEQYDEVKARTRRQ